MGTRESVDGGLASCPRRDRGRAWPPALALALPLALPLAGIAGPAHALEVGWLVGGGLEYSDNIDSAPEGDEDSEWIRDVRAGLVLQQETSRVQAQFDGLILLEDYADNSFSEGALFEGGGSADIELVPDRLTWVVRDRFQQVPEITRTAPTPGNEQNANAFVTGPDLELPLGAATALRLGARYGDYYFEETDEDHARRVGQIGIARQLSSISELSLNARTEDVTFDSEDLDDSDDDVREDFVSDSAFLRYERRMANDGRLTVDLGGYDIERDELPDADGELGSISLHRGIGANAAAGVRVEHGPTDIGAAVSAFGDDPLDANVENVAVTGDVGEEDTVRAYYSHRFGRLSFNLNGGASEEDFIVADGFDRDLAYVALGIDYRMTPRRTVFAEARRTQVEYVDDDPPAEIAREREYDDYDDYRYSLGVDQRLGSALTLMTELAHDRRYAHGGGHDFEENLVRVTLVYGFGHPDVIGELPDPDEDV